MKGVFVIIDGVADEPSDALGGKTPLEAAKTPNLDLIAKKSKIEHCYPIKEGVAPESSSAIVSLLGYDPSLAPRGPLEAQGAGVKIRKGDLVLRTNFATIDNLEDRNIMDSRAGRTLTTAEAKRLADVINKKVKLKYKFEFVPTIQHRGVLVIKGGFSDNISNTDPRYGNGIVSSSGGEKMQFSRSLDDEEDSKLSADTLNKFIRDSFEVLNKHPINVSRAKKGLHSANVLLCRDAGGEPVSLKKEKGKWMALGYMPLEIGIAQACGMDVYKFKYPDLRKNDVYSLLYFGLKKAIGNAIEMLKKNKDKYDYFYVHFKETDVPGHDGKAEEKVKMIELIDERFFSFLKNFVKDERIVVTADHTTSCKKKMHTADSVPVMFFDSKVQGNGGRFTEADGRKGKKMLGNDLLGETLFRE